jgi:hypothetical protein
MLSDQLLCCAQEVFGSASPRMSIQGWYHADAPPPGADKASLSLLQAMREDGEDESYEFPEVEDPQEDEGGLNEADLAALRKFVNPVYLSDAALEVRGVSTQRLRGKDE